MNKKPLSGLALIIIALAVITIHAEAQIKIFIDTDLEGISGVYSFSQTREKGTPLNIQACEYFMGDLAEVIRGLKDAGVDEIVVADSHGSGALIPHLMVPGARYITGRPRPYPGSLWSLDSTFSGLIMLGFHAMNGTPDGVLHHTQSSKIELKYWYNGVEFGELGQDAAYAGSYGVPSIMISGDVAVCREARKFLGNEIITVETKKGINREAAVLYPFEETRKALYEGAKQAVKAIPKCKPYILEGPIKARKEYLDQNPDLKEKKTIVKETIIPNARRLFDF